MHTAKEANQLWCPVSGGERTPSIRVIGPTAKAGGWSRCIGDQCAAWRWAGPAQRKFVLCDDAAATVEPKRPDLIPNTWKFCPSEDGEPAGWVQPDDEAMAERMGYCGLAGIPQPQE